MPAPPKLWLDSPVSVVAKLILIIDAEAEWVHQLRSQLSHVDGVWYSGPACITRANIVVRPVDVARGSMPGRAALTVLQIGQPSWIVQTDSIFWTTNLEEALLLGLATAPVSCREQEDRVVSTLR